MSDTGMERIPVFSLESFETDEAAEDPELPAIDEKGCLLLPLKRRITQDVCKEEPEEVREEEPKAPEPEEASQEEKAEEPPRETEEELQRRMENLEREAYEKGFAQGQRDGQALEEKQLQERSKHLDALFSSISGLKEEIYKQTKEEIVRLSTAIAKKIIRNELKAGNHRIEQTILAAMKLLVDTSNVRIRIHPEDMEEVSRLAPSLAAGAKAGRIQILEDQAVQRGGCILQTGFGNVNATVQDQLAAVEKEIERVLDSEKGGSP